MGINPHFPKHKKGDKLNLRTTGGIYHFCTGSKVFMSILLKELAYILKEDYRISRLESLDVSRMEELQ